MSKAHSLEHWPQVLMNTYGLPTIEVVDAHDCTLVDAAGREYLDLLAGIAVNALGYGNEAVATAVSEQVRTFAHVSNFFASAPVVEAAEELVRRVGDPSARVFFCNSGTEANEAALKLSRLTGRRRVLAADKGFHGRTMGALSMTGQPSKRAPFEPLPTGVEFYPFGDIDYLTALVEINPTDVAAIILEPIQGETGVIPAPEGFLAAVRELCDRHGILFVVDEVQTGVGRTGTFFAFEQDGILPDVITMAKGLGGGLPIGACIGIGPAATLFGPGSHGTTFGGNPVACAAAGTVLSIVDDDFCAEVAAKGQRLAEGLRAIDGVAEVRGRGLMLGAVLERPVAKAAVKAGYSRGVILNAPSEDVLRLTPPLVISEADIDSAVARVAQALGDAMDNQATEGEA